jgi:hypothetical protein
MAITLAQYTHYIEKAVSRAAHTRWGFPFGRALLNAPFQFTIQQPEGLNRALVITNLTLKGNVMFWTAADLEAKLIDLLL